MVFIWGKADWLVDWCWSGTNSQLTTGRTCVLAANTKFIGLTNESVWLNKQLVFFWLYNVFWDAFGCNYRCTYRSWLIDIYSHIYAHTYIHIHNVLTNTQLLHSYYTAVAALLAVCVCLSLLILHFSPDFHWAAARVPRLLWFVAVTCFVLGVPPWWNNESHAVVTGIVASSVSEIAGVQQIRPSGSSTVSFLCLVDGVFTFRSPLHPNN